MTHNKEIREVIKDSGLKMYQVAHVYGVTDGNFSRLLRFELSADKRKLVLEAIEKAKQHFENR